MFKCVQRREEWALAPGWQGWCRVLWNKPNTLPSQGHSQDFSKWRHSVLNRWYSLVFTTWILLVVCQKERLTTSLPKGRSQAPRDTPPLPAMPLSENSWEEFLITALSCKKLSVIKGSLLFSFFSFLFFFSRLPGWMRSYIPKIFYVEEKAWNYYPFTITGQ